MTVRFEIPEIVTDRLRLRLPKLSDVPRHIAFRASARSKGVGGPFEAHTAFHNLAGVIGQWHFRGYGRWMVADLATDAPLGLVGIYHPGDWPEPEIGWTVYEEAEGRGIALEAALATRDFVYNTLGWSRVVSLVMADNDRSVRLAERLGCVKDGTRTVADLGTLDIWVHPAPEVCS